MAKGKRNTRRGLHRIARREREERKAERGEDSNFRYRHDAGMRKMLQGVDPDRFERLADGRV